MKFKTIKFGEVKTLEELQEKIKSALAELNGSAESDCWICGKSVKNWGVLLPDSEDGLGLGHKPGATRFAFFPYCAEHKLSDIEILSKVIEHLKKLRSQIQN